MIKQCKCYYSEILVFQIGNPWLPRKCNHIKGGVLLRSESAGRIEVEGTGASVEVFLRDPYRQARFKKNPQKTSNG